MDNTCKIDKWLIKAIRLVLVSTLKSPFHIHKPDLLKQLMYNLHDFKLTISHWALELFKKHVSYYETANFLKSVAICYLWAKLINKILPDKIMFQSTFYFINKVKC